MMEWEDGKQMPLCGSEELEGQAGAFAKGQVQLVAELLPIATQTEISSSRPNRTNVSPKWLSVAPISGFILVT